MAVPANTVTRYPQIGVREQLMDAITRTDPEQTPVTSGMARINLTNTNGEYLRDTLRDPNENNAHLDGDDATNDPQVQPERLMCHPQIFRGVVSTSGRANAVTTAGRATEQSYQIGRELKGLQFDMEKVAIGLKAAVVGSAGVAPRAASIATHLFSNALTNGAGAFAPHTAGAATTAPTPGTPRPFANGLLESAMQSCYDASGQTPDMVVMSSNHKVTFSTFAGLAGTRDTRSRGRSAESQVVAGADLYVSNFGTLQVVPHWMMVGYTYVLGLVPKYNKMAYLRPLQKTRLAKNGDSDRDMLLIDAGFCVKAEKPQFVIADLTA